MMQLSRGRDPTQNQFFSGRLVDKFHLHGPCCIGGFPCIVIDRNRNGSNVSRLIRIDETVALPNISERRIVLAFVCTTYRSCCHVGCFVVNLVLITRIAAALAAAFPLAAAPPTAVLVSVQQPLTAFTTNRNHRRGDRRDTQQASHNSIAATDEEY